MTSWPLRPMSATWVRAQALGQPLTLTVIGTSRSGKRRSSSATRSRARALVSTIASLQNSMPVQAIVFCRQFDGRAGSPIASSAVDQRLDLLGRDADQHDLLVRREPGARDAVPLHQVGEVDQHRARDAAGGRRDADVEVAVLLRVHADVVAVADRGTAGSRSGRAGGRGTRSRAPRGTSRRPSRRPGTSAGRASAAGGSRSRGRSRRRPPRRRRTSSSGIQTPIFWASIGLVDRPPPTQRSKPGPCSGCTVPTNDDVVGLGGHVVAGVAGQRGLELARAGWRTPGCRCSGA